MSPIVSAHNRLIGYVEELEFDKNEVSAVYERGYTENYYSGKLIFGRDGFDIEVHYYINTDDSDRNKLTGVRLVQHYDGHVLHLSGVGESVEVFSESFNRKAIEWACDAMGLDEPTTAAEWFAARLGI